MVSRFLFPSPTFLEHVGVEKEGHRDERAQQPCSLEPKLKERPPKRHSGHAPQPAFPPRSGPGRSSQGLGWLPPNSSGVFTQKASLPSSHSGAWSHHSSATRDSSLPASYLTLSSIKQNRPFPPSGSAQLSQHLESRSPPQSQRAQPAAGKMGSELHPHQPLPSAPETHLTQDALLPGLPAGQGLPGGEAQRLSLQPPRGNEGHPPCSPHRAGRGLRCSHASASASLQPALPVPPCQKESARGPCHREGVGTPPVAEEDQGLEELRAGCPHGLTAGGVAAAPGSLGAGERPESTRQRQEAAPSIRSQVCTLAPRDPSGGPQHRDGRELRRQLEDTEFPGLEGRAQMATAQFIQSE